ncbi:hypothetical protein G6F68_013543 [Rhizopus microsporus]|nr:hypothetical protein G6F68_013543 [Rhizopus microsporus]
MSLALAQHFLQEHHVRRGGPQGCAQVVQHEAPVEAGEPFMGVDGQHRQPPGGIVVRGGHGLSGVGNSRLCAISVPGPASRRAQQGKIARLAERSGRLVRKNRYARQIFPTPGSDMTIANKKHYHAASHRSCPMSSSRSRPHGFLAYYEELLAVWTRKLGCRDAAQDLTHDAFVKCLEAGSDHVEQPRAYLHQAARNTAVDGFRREGGHEWGRRWKPRWPNCRSNAARSSSGNGWKA